MMNDPLSLADGFQTINFRALWILLAMGYFSAASYLALSSHQYRRWIWAAYYTIGAAILVFFNIDYYDITPFLLQSAEFLLWVGGAVGGLGFFVVLLSIADLVDSGLVELPTLRELPGFLWRWATGAGDEMRVGFAVCTDCGQICRAEIHDDGEIVPTGVGECPRCEDTGSWKELHDQHDGWPSDEEE